MLCVKVVELWWEWPLICILTIYSVLSLHLATHLWPYCAHKCIGNVQILSGLFTNRCSTETLSGSFDTLEKKRFALALHTNWVINDEKVLCGDLNGLFLKDCWRRYELSIINSRFYTNFDSSSQTRVHHARLCFNKNECSMAAVGRFTFLKASCKPSSHRWLIQSATVLTNTI